MFAPSRRDGGDVASAHSAGADSRDIDSLARRDVTRPPSTWRGTIVKPRASPPVAARNDRRDVGEFGSIRVSFIGCDLFALWVECSARMCVTA